MPWQKLPAECRKTLWRGSPIADEIKEAVSDGRCGRLCSLRFTWMRPAEKACMPSEFTEELLSSARDAAEYISGSPLETEHIRQFPGTNNVFGLLKMQNGVVAELEINEELPASMPDIFFIKANFDQGHLTNQPLTGFFNTEGMIQADDNSCVTLIMENPGLPAVCGPIEQMIQRRLDLFNAVE